MRPTVDEPDRTRPRANSLLSPARALVERTLGSDPLLRNASYLILNTGISSALGLVYWIAVARMFDADIVGVGSGLVSAMIALSGVAQLNLAVALPHLIPAGRRHAHDIVKLSYAANCLLSVLLATAFVLIAPRITESFRVFDLWMGAAFVLSVTTWGIFALQDGVLTATRRTRWIAIENAVYGAAKLGAAVVFAVIGLRQAVFLSWVLPVLLIVVPVTVLLLHRVMPQYAMAASSSPSQPLRSRETLRALGLDYVASLMRMAHFLFIPVFVIARLGEEANAYLAAALAVAFAVDAAGTHLATSLTVEAAHQEERLHDLVVRTARRLGWLLGLGVLIVVLLAPVVLRVFGQDYADNATGALRLLALAAVPRALIAMYAAVCRVERRMLGVVVAQLVATAMTVVLAVVLVERTPSITAVGAAWLAAHVAAAGLVVVMVLMRVPHVRTELRRTRQ